MKFGRIKGPRAYVPAQEIILVWVFVINLHLQLLTRNFMDNDLMHQTHTQGHENWRGSESTLALASCPHKWKRDTNENEMKMVIARRP